MNSQKLLGSDLDASLRSGPPKFQGRARSLVFFMFVQFWGTGPKRKKTNEGSSKGGVLPVEGLIASGLFGILSIAALHGSWHGGGSSAWRCTTTKRSDMMRPIPFWGSVFVPNLRFGTTLDRGTCITVSNTSQYLTE